VVYRETGYFSIIIYIYGGIRGWSLVYPLGKSRVIAKIKKFSPRI